MYGLGESGKGLSRFLPSEGTTDPLTRT